MDGWIGRGLVVHPFPNFALCIERASVRSRLSRRLSCCLSSNSKQPAAVSAAAGQALGGIAAACSLSTTPAASSGSNPTCCGASSGSNSTCCGVSQQFQKTTCCTVCGNATKWSSTFRPKKRLPPGPALGGSACGPFAAPGKSPAAPQLPAATSPSWPGRSPLC